MTAEPPATPPAEGQEDDVQLWSPPLFKGQDRVFNVGTAAHQVGRSNIPWCVLVAGSRYSGKTYAALHRVVRHLWETDCARVAMVAKWMKNLTDMGSFMDLTERVLPLWFAAGFGMEYTTFDRSGEGGHRVSAKTRTIYFRVRNKHGTESELRLFSMANESEIVDKLKNHSFSMVYISELTTFSNPALIAASVFQLRCSYLPDWQHMLLADTNPSDEGEDNWVYRMFFLKQAANAKLRKYLESTTLIQLFMRDNPLLSDERKEHFEGLCSSDPGIYARDIEGKWTKGHGTSGLHFADIYSFDAHIIGGREGERDTIDVDSKTTELIDGWDLGQVNHAWVLLEKRIAHINGREVSTWIAHDELESVGEQMQIEEFTHLVQAKMREIEARAGRKFDYPRHWSDDSALLVRRGAGEGTDALEVYIHSNREIELDAVEKPDGSVRSRVTILRRLLKEGRFFAAARCRGVQRMLEKCKKGTAQKEYVAWDENKHIFDALTYPIFMESRDELLNEAYRPQATEARVSDSASVDLNPLL